MPLKQNGVGRSDPFWRLLLAMMMSKDVEREQEVAGSLPNLNVKECEIQLIPFHLYQKTSKEVVTALVGVVQTIFMAYYSTVKNANDSGRSSGPRGR